MNRREAGRLGGLTTFMRYGKPGMAARGRLGGRPRAITLEDVERLQLQAQLQQAEEEENEQRRMDTCRVRSLRSKKKLWRQRQRSVGSLSFLPGRPLAAAPKGG